MISPELVSYSVHTRVRSVILMRMDYIFLNLFNHFKVRPIRLHSLGWAVTSGIRVDLGPYWMVGYNGLDMS